MKIQGYFLLLLFWGISVSCTPGIFAQSMSNVPETAAETNMPLHHEQGLTEEQPVVDQMPVQAGPLLEVSVSGDPVRKVKPVEANAPASVAMSEMNLQSLVAYRAGKPISGADLLKLSAQDQQTVLNDPKTYPVEPSSITAETIQQLPLTMQVFIQKHPSLFIVK